MAKIEILDSLRTHNRKAQEARKSIIKEEQESKVPLQLIEVSLLQDIVHKKEI